MAQYLVGVKEVYERMVMIEANNEEEARELVENGEGTECDDQSNVVCALDRDEWNVYLDTK